jgi:hypothetical protein
VDNGEEKAAAGVGLLLDAPRQQRFHAQLSAFIFGKCTF